MKRIAVLMTCYNRVKTTLECLHKLYINKLPEGFSLDIWLVDDASPDRTGDKVKAEYPQVNVIRGSGKLFWCKGMRLAWEKAASAYDYDGYLWLNDDVMLFSDGLSSLFKDMITIFQSGQECGVVVGTCVERKGGALTYGCYGENGVMAPSGHPQVADDKWQMSGNVVLVPRAVFNKIGFVCGKYMHACGDSDYRQLMIKNGVPMYCASQFAGACPKQPDRYVNPKDIAFIKRVQLLFSPKGKPLHDVFLFRYRHWGVVRALLSVAHVALKTLFP